MNKLIIYVLAICSIALIGCTSVDYEEMYNLKVEEHTSCMTSTNTLTTQLAQCNNKPACPAQVGCNTSEIIDLITPDNNCLLKLRKAEVRIEILEEGNNSLECMNLGDDLNNCELALNVSNAKLLEIEEIFD